MKQETKRFGEWAGGWESYKNYIIRKNPQMYGTLLQQNAREEDFELRTGASRAYYGAKEV